MYAAPKDRVGTGDGRVGELYRIELGLHGLAYIPAYMRPGLRIPTGSKACLSAAVNAMSGASSGWNTSITARACGSGGVSRAWAPKSARGRRGCDAPAAGR